MDRTDGKKFNKVYYVTVLFNVLSTKTKAYYMYESIDCKIHFEIKNEYKKMHPCIRYT